MKQVRISRADALLANASLCDTFLSETRGYMFRQPIGSLLFRLPWQTRLLAAIHTFLVSCPLQVAWLDNEIVVMDVATVGPWRIRWPKHAARYIIETPADQPLPINIGDRLGLEPL